MNRQTIIKLSIAVFIGLSVFGLFYFWSSDISPDDKFESSKIINEKTQNFGDGSSWYHFTIDSNELKTYLKNFDAKGSGTRAEYDFNYFWPQEAPKWFNPQKFGDDTRVFRRDYENVTEFFLVNTNFTEVYYQHTAR